MSLARRRDAAAVTGETRLVDGEYPFTAEDFDAIAARLHADSGIALAPAKAALVYSRLARRLRALGLESFRDYRARLDGPQGAEERAALLSALTTNVTRFFREPHHFDLLRRRMRETLAPAARAGGRVRLWSAGCSLGHEPWSMALCVLAELPEAARLDVRILATDIDPQVVARARRGEYAVEEAAAVPEALRGQGFRLGGGVAAIAPSLPPLVRFGVLNLHADWPMRGGFDLIFCRNVAIYFDGPTQARLWSRLGRSLNPDGRLCIGHSERIDDPELTTDGLTVYRRSTP